MRKNHTRAAAGVVVIVVVVIPDAVVIKFPRGAGEEAAAGDAAASMTFAQRRQTRGRFSGTPLSTGAGFRMSGNGAVWPFFSSTTATV